MTLKIAAIAISREVRACGEVRTHDGDEFWVVKDEFGISTLPVVKGEHPPQKLMVWDDTVAAAKELAKWKGHPWWVDVKQIMFLNVTPHYEQIVKGYYRIH